MANQTDYTDSVQVMQGLTRIHFATQQRQKEQEIRDRAQAADDAEHDRLVKIARLVLEDGEGVDTNCYVQGYGTVDAFVVRHGDDVLVAEKNLYTLLPAITAEQVAAVLDEPKTCPDPNNPGCRCKLCLAVQAEAPPILTDDDAIYNATIDAFELPDDEPISFTDGRKFHLPNGVPATVFPASVPGLGLDGGEGKGVA